MATTRKAATKTAAEPAPKPATTKKPAPKRRTAEESAEAVATAARLRDRGVPGPIVVGQLQRRLGVSRAQAYRYLALANEQRSSDGGLPAPPQFSEIRQMLVMGLTECFADAIEDGDRKEVSRISKELRETLKLGGFSEHREQDEQERMVRQTYGRNGDPKGTETR